MRCTVLPNPSDTVRQTVFDDATILITGGTGSFGRQYVKMLLANFKPQKVIVFSRDELKQSEMQHEYPQKLMRCF